MTLPIAEVLRTLLGWVGLDLIRWLWESSGRAPPRRQWDRRCEWCNGAYVVERSTEPPRDEMPPGWVGDETRRLVWCSLRCWVDHWRADPRIESPPAPIASGMWRDDWTDADSD